MHFLSILLAATCLGCPGADTTRVVVLENVTVIDGTGSAPRSGMTIVVRGDRIAEIHEVGARSIPAGATRLDVAGKYVMPGLIDAHVHLASFDRPITFPTGILRFALLGGVTTVRDMGGQPERLAELVRASRAADAPSPRVYHSAVFAGPAWFASYDTTRLRYWSGDRPVGMAPGVRRIDDTTNIEAAVRQAAALGAHGVKLYSDLTPQQLREITRHAHAAGLRVWAHAVVPPSRPDDVVLAGVDAVSHADQLIWITTPRGFDGSRETRVRLMTEFAPTSAPVAALLDSMRAEGTLFEPTLYVMQQGGFQQGEAGPPSQVAQWSIDVTREALRRGVRIVAGTDAIGLRTPFIHAELQLLVRQAGLTPLEAIRAATENAAAALGLADSTGTVAVGKWADLVVLDADPSVDIRNTQTVRLVLRGGVVHQRPAGPWELAPGAEGAR